MPLGWVRSSAHLGREGVTTGGQGTAAAGAAAGLPEDLGSLDDAGLVSADEALERLKSACAATQAVLTARFVDAQAAEAQRLRDVAQDCSDAGDFEGWVAARDRADALELPSGESTPTPAGGHANASATSPSASAESTSNSADGRAGDECRGDGDAGWSRAKRRRAAAIAAKTGVSAQVGLARHESPARGARLARAAVTLVEDLPHTLAALAAGHLNERRAELVVKGTSHLRTKLRAAVDAEVIGANLPEDGDPPGSGLAGWGDAEVERRVRACADRLDAAAAVERARVAESQRRVTMRPVPDAMALLSAVLPVAQAVAVNAALAQAAAAAKAKGDDRSRGQVMADTLVERVTGRATAENVDIEVQVVITDRALIAGDDTPAQVVGYGPVPAGWARALLTRDILQAAIRHDALRDGAHRDGAAGDGAAGDGADRDGAAGAKIWFRRLYTHPGTGTLVAMESKRRLFPAGLRRYLVARDGACRTPWCDAPIRHADHITPHARGGPTTADNGQGLCVACNLTKDLPGWSSRLVDPGPAGGSIRPHTVEISTPTGHRYVSVAPPLLPERVEPQTPCQSEPHEAGRGPVQSEREQRGPRPLSPVEAWFTEHLAA